MVFFLNNFQIEESNSSRMAITLSSHHPFSIPIDFLIYYFTSKFNQKIAISFYDWKTIKKKADAKQQQKIYQHFNIEKIGPLCETIADNSMRWRWMLETERK